MKMGSRFSRLSSSDLGNLRLEKLRSPFHFGGLVILDGSRLLDEAGQLLLEDIRSRLDRRLARVPQLRRRVYFPGPLGGPALWVDDDRFDIRNHVRETFIDPPAGEVELLETAAGVFGRLLDRSRPLWELQFLTGLSGNRVGALLKLHHSVADGMAALAIMASLFDSEPEAPEPTPVSWSPPAIPRAWTLFYDNLSIKLSGARDALTALGHPIRRLQGFGTFVVDGWRTLQQRSRAPKTSINQTVQPGRRVRFMRLSLGAAREQAHAAGAKVNDVVLDLVAGGLRELLIARGEGVAGVELISTVAVSLRPSSEAQTLGNQVGVLAVPLAVGEGDNNGRLEMIARATRQAKAEQHPGAIQSATGGLAATPLAQYLMRHQHWVNVFSTNLVGPPVPVYVLGAPILDIVPIIQVVGNVTLAFCAISYAGRLYLVVTADATAVPDIDVLMTGMERAWRQLREAA